MRESGFYQRALTCGESAFSMSDSPIIMASLTVKTEVPLMAFWDLDKKRSRLTVQSSKMGECLP